MALALCVVGCGQFARTFAKSVRSFGGFPPSQGVDLFFASRDRRRARAYARRFGGLDFYGSYEEAAADPRVEAMYLCTPHHLHMEQAIMAASHGKHILVEKPIARNMAEGRRIVASASAAGVVLMVAENYRFMPVVQKARELVRAGAVGTLRYIQIQAEANYDLFVKTPRQPGARWG